MSSLKSLQVSELRPILFLVIHLFPICVYLNVMAIRKSRCRPFEKSVFLTITNVIATNKERFTAKFLHDYSAVIYKFFKVLWSRHQGSSFGTYGVELTSSTMKHPCIPNKAHLKQYFLVPFSKQEKLQ